MDAPDWQFADDVLIVGVGHGMYPKRDALQFRVSPDVAPDLVQAFQAEGLDVGPVPMASVGPQELAAFAVMTGGALAGVAAVLRAFFSRNQHRSVLLRPDGTYALKGMSVDEMERLIDRELNRALEQQKKSDELWDEVMPPREEDDQ